MPKINVLIFDADDTLWDNNRFFVKATEEFFDLCVNSGINKDDVISSFNDFEFKVVKERGYGSHNFLFILNHLFDFFSNKTQLDPIEFNSIIKRFKNHLVHKPALFAGVDKTLKQLKNNYKLCVLTKGHIQEQEEKLDKSGLLKYFDKLFIESEKNDQTYISILSKNKWKSTECCMIGNSPKSDINPALRLGLYAIYIPYPFTWRLDDEQIIEDTSKLFQIKKFEQIPAILHQLSKS